MGEEDRNEKSETEAGRFGKPISDQLYLSPRELAVHTRIHHNKDQTFISRPRLLDESNSSANLSLVSPYQPLSTREYAFGICPAESKGSLNMSDSFNLVGLIDLVDLLELD